jgi:hypothetical protein
VPESKMQIVTSDLMDSKTIMTILPTGECMEEDPDVCHPQVRVDYIDDKNMIESIILKKGEGFGFQGSKYFTLADAHTYSKNKNNYVVYGRIEILISSNGKNTKKVEAPKYSNMEYFSPSKQYCTSSFDKDTLEVIHSCGLGSFWKRVVKFIDKSGGFGGFSNPEIMC